MAFNKKFFARIKARNIRIIYCSKNAKYYSYFMEIKFAPIARMNLKKKFDEKCKKFNRISKKMHRCAWSSWNGFHIIGRQVDEQDEENHDAYQQEPFPERET